MCINAATHDLVGNRWRECLAQLAIDIKGFPEIPGALAVNLLHPHISKTPINNWLIAFTESSCKLKSSKHCQAGCIPIEGVIRKLVHDVKVSLQFVERRRVIVKHHPWQQSNTTVTAHSQHSID